MAQGPRNRAFDGRVDPPTRSGTSAGKCAADELWKTAVAKQRGAGQSPPEFQAKNKSNFVGNFLLEFY